LPHRLWATWYTSISYNPTPDSRLLHANDFGGRVHTDASTLNNRSTFPCSGNVYHGGRVLGQALWKTVWGIDISAAGAQQPIAAIGNAGDFLLVAYFASILANQYSLEMFSYVYAVGAHWGQFITPAQARRWCQMFEKHMPNVRGNYFNASCDF
jgi:hypothetical protein